MPQDKDHKHLDLLVCKVYTSSTLQFRIANYSAILDKYDFDNNGKLFKFTIDIAEDRRAQFKLVLVKGQLVARMALQASLDRLIWQPVLQLLCTELHGYHHLASHRSSN